MDMTTITGLVGSLKAATDITRAIVELRDTQLVQGKVIELQREIMAAQGSALVALTERAAMVTEIDKLKARIAELDAWDQEKARYQLTEHGGGTFTYKLKVLDGEPPHRICPHCYQKRRKSILQCIGTSAFKQEGVICPACKTELWLGVAQQPRGTFLDEDGRSGWTG